VTNSELGRRKFERVVLAFVAGPLAASAVSAVFFYFLGEVYELPGKEALAVIIALFLPTLILGYLSAVIVGIPRYLIFLRRGRSSRGGWFVFGAAIGGGTAMLNRLIAIFADGKADFGADAGDIVHAALLAATTGLVFAWVVRPRQDINGIAATFD
jgi:hypothetical protein